MDKKQLVEHFATLGITLHEVGIDELALDYEKRNGTGAKLLITITEMTRQEYAAFEADTTLKIKG